MKPSVAITSLIYTFGFWGLGAKWLGKTPWIVTKHIFRQYLMRKDLVDWVKLWFGDVKNFGFQKLRLDSRDIEPHFN